MPRDNKPPRMTRAQIAEALDTVPLDTILAGARTESRLSPKQKEFARQLALGKSKAQSYREAYKSKGNSKTQANHGYRLSQSEDIQAIKTAYEVAIEAAKQRTPAQLRELVIHQLTAHAISDEVPPAQRIQALKLLGTVSEVAAFTERKEVTNIRKSEDVRSALLEKLRTISGTAVDAVLIPQEETADSLLAEIHAGNAANAAENAQPAAQDDPPPLDPTRPPPPSIASDHPDGDLHSIPHSEAPVKSLPHSVSLEKSNQSDVPDSLDISDAEIIGIDEHVSLCIDEMEPIVAEKVPAGDPTPSDIETPPVDGTD